MAAEVGPVRLAPRWLWPTLVALGMVVLVVQVPGEHATAWHFFDDAARLLTGRGPEGERAGLFLYADHPEFQFGPLSIVVAVPFSLLGATAGSWAAMAVTSLAGVVAFGFVLATAERLRPGLVSGARPVVLLVAGATAVVTWGDVSVRTAHIDDALALVAITVALHACAGDRAGVSVVALAVAAAAKPWGIVFAPLALVPQGRRVLRLVSVGVLAALTWVPFVLAEPRTLDTRDFLIDNDPTSVLRALGVSDPFTPSWVRPVQLLGGLLIVTALVLTRRWPAVLLAGVAWRLLFDPGAHRYYTIGIVLGGLLVELLRRPGRVPLLTLGAALVLEVTALPGMHDETGRYLRLECVVLALLAAVSTPPEPSSREPADRSSPLDSG